VFLQVLDDGRLTDGQGRVVDFKNTLIIMTSNIPLPDPSPGSGESLDRGILSELRKYFRPEFLNRIDEVVRFAPLGKEALGRIVDIQMARVETSLADRKLIISVSPESRDYLASIGYDPDFGARPLKRVIQRTILDPLASQLLKGELKTGDRVEVVLNAKGDGMLFRRIP
jgi:ATP-dependent Clp protease ATP-binding subunit ClpB